MIIGVTMINAWKGDVNEFSSVKVNLILFREIFRGTVRPSVERRPLHWKINRRSCWSKTTPSVSK